MQISIALSDGTSQTLAVDDKSATLSVSWQTKSADGFTTQSFQEAFAASEVVSVGFAADPAPEAPADPAPADAPADAAPATDATTDATATDAAPEATAETSDADPGDTTDAPDPLEAASATDSQTPQPTSSENSNPEPTIADVEAELADAEAKLEQIKDQA